MPVIDKPRTIEGLERHAGEWVAIRDDKVVGSAATLSDLREQLGQERIDGFLQVPPPRRGAGIFL